MSGYSGTSIIKKTWETGGETIDTGMFLSDVSNQFTDFFHGKPSIVAI